MERNGSGVSALLGLDGFVVRAQLRDETPASGGWRPRERGPGLVPDLWDTRRGPWSPTGHGAGLAAGRPAGGAGVGQAAVALPEAGLPAGHVVGGVR